MRYGIILLLSAFTLSACAGSTAPQSTANGFSGAAGGTSPQGQTATDSATGSKEASTPIVQEGFISDSTCGASHVGMLNTGSMGTTNKSCVLECIRAGSRFVFVTKDGKKIFKLRDQTSARKFAGQRVKVTGDICSAGSELAGLSIEAVGDDSK